jgi:hypothetical protein
MFNLPVFFPHRSRKITKRILGTVIVLAMILSSITLSGCSDNKPQSDIPVTAITQTPENVARSYAAAAFVGDYDSLYLCFPEEYVISMSSDTISDYEAWGQEIQTKLTAEDTVYKGTSSSDAVLLDPDSVASDYSETLAAISLEFGIPSSDVVEIRECAVRVFCTIDGTDKYLDVMVIVYKTGVDWYALSISEKA